MVIDPGRQRGQLYLLLDPVPEDVDEVLAMFLGPPDTAELECRGQPLALTGGALDRSGILPLAPDRGVPPEFRPAVAVWKARPRGLAAPEKVVH